ncbi:type II toxin-antitoxin system VapC family toxin [Rodentibacter myodis]|uniref:Ribonuclease VapC n=1 Tax=Rodentibacter myodis TaxID=1907939 RepID=A0A1V3JUZ3_9PAST|nr:type II toxin-antitoxin system VapC family toxin [Rodentibacter myodis]OOF60148.1 VapC toxin family PIN domain ribonuclease [Rodentibacter myodis]
MKYLLDTNAVIALLNHHPNFIARLKQHSPNDFVVSSIVMFELYYGANKSQKVKENLAKLDKLIFEEIPFDHLSAMEAGKIRAHLSKVGLPIGPYDTMIAGQAIAHDFILITHNVKEFERVPDLKFEDWL